MLTSVEITSFRSCRDTRLDNLGLCTVLVGRNGAGKSNILQAIEWIAQVASSQNRVSVSSSEHFSASVEFTIDSASYRFSASLKWQTANQVLQEQLSQLVDGKWERLLTRDGDSVKFDGILPAITLQPNMPSLPALISLLPKETRIAKHLDNVTTFFSSIRYYPIDETSAPGRDRIAQDVIMDTSYNAWLAEYKSTGRAKDEPQHKLLYLSLNPSDQLDELKSLLGQDGLGIIDEIHFEGFKPQTSKNPAELSNTFYFIGFVPSGTVHIGDLPPYRQYSDLSHGTRRVLRILLAVLFDKSSVMLLEHPEDGIHPGLLKKLIGLLKSYASPSQLICASHSAEVFNMLAPDDVRLVSLSDGATAVRSLTAQEIDAVTHYISEEGPLSDFLESIQDT